MVYHYNNSKMHFRGHNSRRNDSHFSNMKKNNCIQFYVQIIARIFLQVSYGRGKMIDDVMTYCEKYSPFIIRPSIFGSVQERPNHYSEGFLLIETELGVAIILD